MPRHIDADKVMEEIARIGGHNLCGWDTIGVKALIDRQPTADVVPKSEVDLYRKQVDELEDELSSTYDKLENAKSEVAREIIDDILSKIRTMIKEIEKVERCGNSYYSEFNGGSKTALEIVFKDIAELKKKYKEDPTDGI